MANISKKINIVADCDEVLTYISPAWYGLLVKEYDYFSQYMNLDKNFDLFKDFGKILARSEFSLEKAYKRTDENAKPMDDEFHKNFYAVADFGKLYSMFCKATPMAIYLKELLDTTYVSNLHIVTRCLPNSVTDKLDFLHRIFDNNSKVVYHTLELGESKSEYINKHIGQIDAFFDDELSNVKDVILNCNKEIDIYVPELGYNKLSMELFDLADENEKCLKSYPIIKRKTK